MLNFPITILLTNKRYHLTVQQVPSDSRNLEYFKVYPEANRAKYVLIHGNRPLHVRMGDPHFPIYWGIEEGDLSPEAFEKITEEIEKRLKNL